MSSEEALCNSIAEHALTSLKRLGKLSRTCKTFLPPPLNPLSYNLRYFVSYRTRPVADEVVVLEDMDLMVEARIFACHLGDARHYILQSVVLFSIK